MAVYRAPDQAPKKKSPLGKILLIVLVLLIALAGLAAWTITGEIGGRSADPDQEITVTVEQGSGLSAIADSLGQAVKNDGEDHNPDAADGRQPHIETANAAQYHLT